MESTNPATNPADKQSFGADWRNRGLRYNTLGNYLRSRFGGRIQKISIDAGFTCPNVDGSVAIGGCTFCDNRSFSPARRVKLRQIADQIEHGIHGLSLKYSNIQGYIAYFQPATNTYAEVERLREVYEQALIHPEVVGMAIGTRPDCVPDDVLDLLEEFAGRTYLSVEYGIQTIHNRSLDWMNRGHHYDVFPDAVQRSRDRGFEICAHIIMGLPGESHDDMMASADEMARLNLDAIKIHNLYAVRNTPLGDQVAAGEIELMGRDDYIRAVVDFLERLPPTMIVERVSGDAPRDFFVGPSWCLDKSGILVALNHEFERRDSWQGKLWCETSSVETSTSCR